MNILALLLLLAPQGTPSHAGLHAADADLFIELPDVQSALEAYDGAPLMELLRDEELNEFLGDMLGDGFDASEWYLEMLGGQLSPLLPGVDPEELLAMFQAVSFSFHAPPGMQVGQSLAESPFSEPGMKIVCDFVSEEAATEAKDYILRAGKPLDAPAEGVKGFTLSGLPNLTLWCRTEGARVVFGGGTVRPGAEGKSLVESDLLKKGRSYFAPESGAVVLQGYYGRSPIDIGFLVSGVLFGLLDDGDWITAGRKFREAGFDPFRGQHVWRVQLDDEGFLLENFAADDGAPGLTGMLIGGRPLDPSWVEPIPQDVMAAYVSAFNGKGLAMLLRAALSRPPNDIEDLKQLEAQLGFTLEGFLSRLGPGLTAYMFPPSGIAIPKTFALIEVSDADSFQADLEKLAAKIGDVVEGMSGRTRDYRVKNAEGERVAIPVTTLQLPPAVAQSMMGVGLSPTFATFDGHVLFGLSSTNVKKELKRLFSGSAGASPNLLESTEITFTDDIESIASMDWGAFFAGILNMARTLGGLMGGMGGGELPFDPTDLPDGEVFTQYMEKTVHVARRVEGGVYRQHRSSFGPETWTAPAVGYLATLHPTPQGTSASVQTTPAAVTSPASNEDLALRTTFALYDVQTGLEVYRLEAGEYPDGLALLRQPTDAYPKGFLEESVLLRDGWGNGLRYQRAADGASFRLWSAGPNGLDEDGKGDDLSVQ